MSLLEAIILGAIQGLTEFLPVSSSGHLEIANALFGVEGESNLTFALAVHAATVLSTIVVFRKDIGRLVSSFFKFKMNDDMRFLIKIGISMIPIVIIGFTLKDKIEEVFYGNLWVVGIMLLVSAMLLWFASINRNNNKNLSYRDAFIIGLAQSIAVMPGLSRSGTTIATGLMLGVKKDQVAPFSFMMVIIPILGINFLDILKGNFSDAQIDTVNIVAGFFTAFITGTLACRTMLKLVARGNLKWFSLYCGIVGSIVLICKFIA